MKEILDHYAQFDTKIILFDTFDPIVCQKVVSQYMVPETLFFEVGNLWLEYYSRKYKYILLPETTGWKERLSCLDNINYIVVDADSEEI